MAKSSSPISLTNRPWGLWATLGLSFVVILVFFSSQAAVFGGLLMVKALQTPGRSLEALASGLDSNGFAVAIATLASTPVCLLLVLWLTRLRPTLHVMNYLGLRRPTKRDLLEWCLVTVMFIVMANLLRSLTDRPLSSDFVQDIYRSAKILPLLYLAVGVMAPWFEEIFVRGFLFKGCSTQTSEVGARCCFQP